MDSASLWLWIGRRQCYLHHDGQTNKVFLHEFGSSMDGHHDLNQLAQSIKMHFSPFILIINIINKLAQNGCLIWALPWNNLLSRNSLKLSKITSSLNHNLCRSLPRDTMYVLFSLTNVIKIILFWQWSCANYKKLKSNRRQDENFNSENLQNRNKTGRRTKMGKLKLGLGNKMG